MTFTPSPRPDAPPTPPAPGSVSSGLVLHPPLKALLLPLQVGGTDIILQLLNWKEPIVVIDTLRMASAFLAHKKFANLFIDKEGVHRILQLQHTTAILDGIGLCLTAIAAVPSVLDRFCQLQSAVPPARSLFPSIAALVVEMLERPISELHNVAADFLHYALSVPCFLHHFDQNPANLQALINVLLAIQRQTTPVSTEDKHVAVSILLALRSWFRAHLILACCHLWPKSKRVRALSRVSSSAYHTLPIDGATMSSILMALEGTLLESISGVPHHSHSTAARPANVVQNPVLMASVEECAQTAAAKKACTACAGLTRLRYSAAVRFMDADGIRSVVGLLPMAFEWQIPDIIERCMDVLELLTVAPFSRFAVATHEVCAGPQSDRGVCLPQRRGRHETDTRQTGA